MTEPAAITHVAHVGPTVAQVGGMETVLKTYEQSEWRHLSTTVIASSARVGLIQQLRLFAEALRACKALPATVALHCHLSQKGSFAREGLIVIREARRRPVFATIHGSSFVATSTSPVWSKLYARVLSRLSAVGVLNEAARETVKSLAPQVPAVLLPNPGPVRDRDLRTSIAPFRDSVRPRVVFAGRVGTRKGIDVLMAAWSIVTDRVLDADLVVLGPIDDDLPESLKESIYPHHAGAVPSNEVGGFLDGAACAVLPSRAEAQPMFLIEAMGRGVPMVVTNVGGMPGLAEGTGLVVAVDDPEALASAIVSILSAPDMSDQMRTRARERYSTEFSDETHEQNLIGFYALA